MNAKICQHCLLFLLFLSHLTALASIPLQGKLIAGKPCPAVHSINKNSNPGNLHIQVDKKYPLRAKNKRIATHFLIDIDGQQRWVAVDCAKESTTEPSSVNEHQTQEYLLAVSWLAAFCQNHQEKPECVRQTVDSFEASNLSLHGLWPQPRNNAYCNVNTTNKAIDRRGAWHLLPELPISDELRGKLNVVMPGTASDLQRHEWYKHGSCYDTAEIYYRDSVSLMTQLNSSRIPQLFVDNVGKEISLQQIRKAFDLSYGPGAGEKVNLRCSGKLITELWINLKGKISPDNSIQQLIHAAPSVLNPHCPGGIIDEVGF